MAWLNVDFAIINITLCFNAQKFIIFLIDIFSQRVSDRWKIYRSKKDSLFFVTEREIIVMSIHHIFNQKMDKNWLNFREVKDKARHCKIKNQE